LRPVSGLRIPSAEENVNPIPTLRSIWSENINLPVPNAEKSDHLLLRCHSISKSTPEYLPLLEKAATRPGPKGILKISQSLRNSAIELQDKTWTGTAPRSLLPVLKTTKTCSRDIITSQEGIKPSSIPSSPASTLRQRSSIPRLHVSFISPKGDSDSASPHSIDYRSPPLKGQSSPTTKPRAPLLLTQLRADRHRQLEMVSKKDKAKKGKPNCGTTAPDLSNNATSSSSEVETHKSNDLSNVQSDFGLLQLNQNPNQLLCLSTPSVVSSEGTFYTPMHTAMNTPRNTPVGSPVKSDDSSDGDFLTAVEELDIEPLELTSPFGSPKKEVVPEAADPLFSKAPADEDCSATLVTNDKASSCLGTPTSGDDTTPTKQKKPENSSRCPLQGSTSLSQHHSHLHLQISESSSTSVLLEDPLSTAEVKVSTRTIGTQTEDEPVIAVETHEVCSISNLSPRLSCPIHSQ
jgi:hypothetical protein